MSETNEATPLFCLQLKKANWIWSLFPTPPPQNSHNPQFLLQVQYLLEAGVPVNDKNPHNRTPLSWAACQGHLEIAKRLIAFGASLSDKYVLHPNNNLTHVHLIS